MRKIVPASLAAFIAVPAIGMALATPATATPAAVAVHPGQSIQTAIDAAAAGSTIMVAAGHYAESLTVTKPITLVGRGEVEISPPAAAPTNACTLDPDSEGRFPGICVVGQLSDPTEESAPVAVPVTDVHISGIDLSGFTAAAVEIYGAEHVTLNRIDATANPGGGVFASHSADVQLNQLTAANNGGRGVDIHESVAGFAITHSALSGNRGEGVFVGDSSGGRIAHNNVSGNCTGILLVDLALPGDTGVTGVRVAHNKIIANNAYCAGDDEGQPAESGNGLVLVGARGTVVTGNQVRGNAAPQPAALSFGGVAVLDAGPFTGGAAPSGNVLTHNVITGNAPMDLLYDGSGTGNIMRDNICATRTTPRACTAGH